MSKTITFVIDGGEVEIKASGFKGSACEAATREFEEALGGGITKKQKTAEYFQQEVKSQRLGAN